MINITKEFLDSLLERNKGAECSVLHSVSTNKVIEYTRQVERDYKEKTGILKQVSSEDIEEEVEEEVRFLKLYLDGNITWESAIKLIYTSRRKILFSID